MSKLSNGVKNDVIKKTVYDESLKKVNVIQTNDTVNLVEKADYNTKTAETEKTILEHDKYITTQELTKLTVENAERLKHANLASKNDIADFVKKILMKN